jgi:hypothetical protein
MTSIRTTHPASGPLPQADLLDPPRGYRLLAWIGLMANLLVIPAVILTILRDPIWRIPNIAVGAGAVLPCAVVGLVACIALLRWRHWGVVLAIVALSLNLAIALPYGIVRLVIVEEGRMALALAFPLLLAAQAAALVFWCRPAVRQYLR